MDSMEPTMTPDTMASASQPSIRGSKTGASTKGKETLDIQEQMDELKRLIMGFQGKFEQILANITDIKRDILIIKRGMPNIRTEGPTNHFNEEYNDRR